MFVVRSDGNLFGDKKLGLTVPEAAALSSLGQTSVYKAIKEGRLRVRKYGTPTIITRADLACFLENLPDGPLIEDHVKHWEELMVTLRKPLAAVLALFSISAARAIEPDDLLVGPISYQQDVNGVSVTLTARTYFKRRAH